MAYGAFDNTLSCGVLTKLYTCTKAMVSAPAQMVSAPAQMVSAPAQMWTPGPVNLRSLFVLSERETDTVFCRGEKGSKA